VSLETLKTQKEQYHRVSRRTVIG